MPKKKGKVTVPVEWPTYICKAQWDATAVKLLIKAKDEIDAWNRAWKQVAHTEGGDSCLKVTVLGVK